MSSDCKSSPSILPTPSPLSNLDGDLESADFSGRDAASEASSDNLNVAHLVEKTRNVRLTAHSNASGVSTDTSVSLNTEYHGPIIPPTSDKSFHRRTLVLCFDGTGDQFDLDNSNVIQFFSVLKKGDRKRQLVYYQSGIGTYTIPQVATPFYSKFSKTLDLMFAKNLNHHVMSGYHFLMQNCASTRTETRSVSGFSRGAYVARALAGMIHKVGLLPAGNEQQVPFAYKMFQNETELGWKQSVAFKKTFCMDVDIAFVGVWDTVASVGLLPSTLPFTKSNTAIKVFRHALSLDERRAKFKPSIYQRITAEEAKRGDFTPPSTRHSSPTTPRGRKRDKTQEIIEVKNMRFRTTKIQEDLKSGRDSPQGAANGDKTKITTESKITRSSGDERRSESGSRSRAILGSLKRSARGISENVQEVIERVSLDREKSKGSEDDKEDLSPDSEKDQLEQMYLDRSRPTDVLEVWFAGCHCDVGGGSVPNATPNSLARIPLRWMIRECFRARTGIQFEAERLHDLGLDPATLYPRVMDIPRPESLDDSVDAGIPRSKTAAPRSPGPKQPTEADRTVESIRKQRTVARTESTAVVNVVEGTLKSAGSIKAAAAVVPYYSKEVRAPNISPEHSRQNNISLDATLVDFERESLDAPDVHVECASVIDERSSDVSQRHEGIHNVPLEGASPKEDNNTLKPPICRPTPSASRTRGLTSSLLEVEENAKDCCSDVYDQLKLAKWWWILELIPFRERLQQKDGTWKKKWSINRGRGRNFRNDEPLHIHRSVKVRMEKKELRYKPRLKYTGDPIWVD